MKKLLVLVTVIGFSSFTFAEVNVTSAPDRKEMGYAIGKQIGSNLKAQGLEVDTVALKTAIDDIMAGKPSAQSEEKTRAVMQQISQLVHAKQEKSALENKSKGEKYLAEYKEKYAGEKDAAKQVKSLESGVMYRILKKGAGKDSPKPESKVLVHYTGKLIDGTEFDSSVKRGEPAEFPVSGVIPGWTQILQKMTTGDKFEVVIPSDLAYREQSTGLIPPNSVLVFEMELLEIKKG